MPPGAGRSRALVAWASAWAVTLLGVFGGVTTVTLFSWAKDPEHSPTTPVGDLGFLVLGCVIAFGFASQVSGQVQRSRLGAAGFQQAVCATLALMVSGLVGNRIEPFVGSCLFLLALLALAASRPHRNGPGILCRRPARDLMALALLATPILLWYAAHLLNLARHAGTSCFVGRCAHGDRFAELAALAIAIVVMGWLASFQSARGRLTACTAGVAALVIGITSLALPGVPEALNRVWAIVIIIWAVALMAIAGRPVPAARQSAPD